MQFCTDCNRCRFTRAELLGEKQLRIAAQEARAGEGEGDVTYPQCVKYLVHYDCIEGGWTCTDCGHRFGSHPAAGTRDEGSVSPALRPITPPTAPTPAPIEAVDSSAADHDNSPPAREAGGNSDSGVVLAAKGRGSGRRNKGPRGGDATDAVPLKKLDVAEPSPPATAPATTPVRCPAAPTAQKSVNAVQIEVAAADSSVPPMAQRSERDPSTMPLAAAPPSKRALKREQDARRAAKREARLASLKATSSAEATAPVPVPEVAESGSLSRGLNDQAPSHTDVAAPPAPPPAACDSAVNLAVASGPTADEPTLGAADVPAKRKNAWLDRDGAAAAATRAHQPPSAPAENRTAAQAVAPVTDSSSKKELPATSKQRGSRKVQLATKSELAPPQGEPLTPVPIAPATPPPDHGRSGPPCPRLADAFAFPDKQRCDAWKKTPGGLEVQLLAQSVQDSKTSTATMILSLLPKGEADPKCGAVFQFQANSAVGPSRSTASFRFVVGGRPIILVETDGQVMPAEREVARTAIEPFAAAEGVSLEALVTALPAEMKFWFDPNSSVTLDYLANDAIAEALW